MELRAKDGRVIFKGNYTEEVDAIEAAVAKGVNLFNADLVGLDLRRAKLPGARLYRADLTDCNLDYANLTGADLSWANLTRATMIKAKLVNADLRRAKLIDTILFAAKLVNANLYCADIRGINLFRTNLTNLTLPDGLKFEYYERKKLPAVLKAGGKTIKDITKTGCWSYRLARNFLRVAYGVTNALDLPDQIGDKVDELLLYYKAGMFTTPKEVMAA